MNKLSKNGDSFYPFFRISTNSRKGIDKTEKESFAFSINAYLNLKTINARFLLKSYQPIHMLINSHIKFEINSKNKKYNFNTNDFRVDNYV